MKEYGLRIRNFFITQQSATLDTLESSIKRISNLASPSFPTITLDFAFGFEVKKGAEE